MKEIVSKICKEDSFNLSYSYMYLHPDYSLIMNSRCAIKFPGKSTRREAINKLFTSNSTPFYLRKPIEFLSVLDSFPASETKDVTITRTKNTLTIMGASKKTTSAFEIIEDEGDLGYAHGNLEFPDYNPEEATCKIYGEFNNIKELLSNEGMVIYKDVMGVHVKKNSILSFDYDLTLQKTFDKPLIPGDNALFIPKYILDLGMLKYLSYIKDDPDNPSIFMMGEKAQIAYTRTAEDMVDDTFENIYDILSYTAATHYDIVLAPEKNSWKRLSAKGGIYLTLEIKNKEIYLSTASTREFLGTTKAPDTNVVVTVTGIKRWHEKCSAHKISIAEDNSIFLSGLTSLNIKFVIYLRGVEIEPDIIMENSILEYEESSETSDAGDIFF